MVHRINVLILSVPEQICQKLLNKHHFTSLPLHMPGMANKKFLDLRLCMGGKVEGTKLNIETVNPSGLLKYNTFHFNLLNTSGNYMCHPLQQYEALQFLHTQNM
jgi:hypothetical protein